eukprot:2812386-Amphidinium_carterae.1
MVELYYARESGGCAKHAFNNLLGGPYLAAEVWFNAGQLGHMVCLKVSKLGVIELDNLYQPRL